MADAPTAAQTEHLAVIDGRAAVVDAFRGDRQARAALSAWLLDGAEIIRRCRVDNSYDRTYCREQITEIAMIALRSFDSYRGAQADSLEYKQLRLWVERELAEAK